MITLFKTGEYYCPKKTIRSFDALSTNMSSYCDNESNSNNMVGSPTDVDASFNNESGRMDESSNVEVMGEPQEPIQSHNVCLDARQLRQDLMTYDIMSDNFTAIRDGTSIHIPGDAMVNLYPTGNEDDDQQSVVQQPSALKIMQLTQFIPPIQVTSMEAKEVKIEIEGDQAKEIEQHALETTEVKLGLKQLISQSEAGNVTSIEPGCISLKVIFNNPQEKDNLEKIVNSQQIDEKIKEILLSLPKINECGPFIVKEVKLQSPSELNEEKAKDIIYTKCTRVNAWFWSIDKKDWMHVAHKSVKGTGAHSTKMVPHAHRMMMQQLHQYNPDIPLSLSHKTCMICKVLKHYDLRESLKLMNNKMDEQQTTASNTNRKTASPAETSKEMASSELADAIDEEYLSCTICTEQFTSESRKPKALSCLHTFCEPCLKKLVLTGGSEVVCPSCKAKTKIPDAGVEKLLTNFLIFGLQDTLASKGSSIAHYCSNCEDDDNQVAATVKCLQCQHYLCNECLSAHKRTKVTKSHRVLTLVEMKSGEYDTEIREAKKIMCEVHLTDPIEFYCSVDKVPTCIKCNQVEHQNHKLIHLSDAASAEKIELQSLMTSLTEKIQCIDTRSQASRSAKTTLIIRMRLLHEIVEKHYTTAFDQLLQQKESVRNQLSQTQKSLDNVNQVGQENIDSAFDTFNSSYDFVQHLLAGSDAEVVKLAGPGKHRIQDLMKMRLPDVPPLTFPKINKPRLQDGSIVKPKLLWQVSQERDSNSHYLEIITFLNQTNNILIKQFSPTDSNTNSILNLDQCGIIQNKCPTPGLKKFDTVPGVGIITCYYNTAGLFVMKPHDGSKKPFTGADSNYSSCVTCTPSRVLTWHSIVNSTVCTVVIYTLDGTKVSQFTYDTVEKQEKLPYMLADDDTQSVYISEWNGQCVYAFTYSGKLRWRYGTEGTGDGQVNGPRGMCFDRNGDIVLADCINNRVHVISPDGYFKYFLLTKEDGIYLPSDVCLNDKGNLLLIEYEGKVKCYDVEY